MAGGRYGRRESDGVRMRKLACILGMHKFHWWKVSIPEPGDPMPAMRAWMECIHCGKLQ